MSFVGDLLGDDGTGLTAKDRAGNIAANTAKATTDALLSNYLDSESNPAKRAAAILANQGAQALIDKIAAKDRRAIPKPYSSGDENGITLIEREYLKTPEHTYNTYFSKTYAGNMEYNDSHPMLTSLFLVDFKFNDSVVANYPSNKLFSMFGKTLPLSMSFLLKNMTFPKITFETVKLNKYNKTVTRPKRMQYDPISITFNEIYTSHQTTNNKRVSLMNMMKEYVSYYTNDAVKSGYNLQNGLSSDREFFNFLSSIDIYFFWNTGAKKISLVNPFIDSFSYGDLSYEEDNVLQLTTNVNYEYVDMFDIDMNINEFIDSASHLLEDVDLGHTPMDEPDADEDVLDRNLLQPLPAAEDTQRRVGLDNPVAAMAIRLAETAALQKFGSNLEDPNPVKRAIAKGALNLAVDAAATTTNAASNSIGAATRGLF